MVVRAQGALAGGCTGHVQGSAETGLRQGLHDLEAEETPRSLSVIPRAASVGINPKITPPDVPGVCLSPVIQGGETCPHRGCPLCLMGKFKEDQRADPGPGACSTTAQ